MILKKPYAFLIKYFKLIHLILFSISGFIIYKSSQIVSFFKSYVKNNYSAIITENMASGFVSGFTYFLVVLLIVLIVIIILLFRYKKKPRKFYIFFTIYYIALLIFLIVVHNVMVLLESTVIEAEVARLLRDISLMIYVPQYAFIILCSVRAIGFNVKQFNFEQDIKELEIKDKDNEEIELSLDFDSYKTKRKFRKFIREFKYYIKENKAIFIIIISILMGLLTYILINTFKSYTENYKINESFNYNNLTLTINDSFITNLDLKGNELKNYYLVLKIKVENNTNNNIKFSQNILRITDGTDYLDEAQDRTNYFKDIAPGYKKDLIKSKTADTYVFVYKVPAEKINNNYYLSIIKGYEKKWGTLVPVTIKTNLDNLIINSINNVSSININEKLLFNNTNLGESYITTQKYEITNSYIYENSGKKDIISSTNNNVLLVIPSELYIDEKSLYYKSSNNINSFISDFISVDYYINTNKYDAKITNVTPKDVDNLIILSVNKEIVNAEKINLNITIRNKNFEIKIK